MEKWFWGTSLGYPSWGNTNLRLKMSGNFDGCPPYFIVHQVVVGNSSWPLQKKVAPVSNTPTPKNSNTHTWHSLRVKSEGLTSPQWKPPRRRKVDQGRMKKLLVSTSWLDSRILEKPEFCREWVEHAVVTHVFLPPTISKIWWGLCLGCQAAQRTKLDKLERKQRRCGSVGYFPSEIQGRSYSHLRIWLKGTLVV